MARQEFPDSLGVKNPFSCHCRRPSQSSGEIFCFVSFLKRLIPGGFPRGSVERSPPASWVQSLDQEDPLEKAMATHSSILAWKIPWMENPRRLQSMGSQSVDTTERLHFHFQKETKNFISSNNNVFSTIFPVVYDHRIKHFILNKSKST